MCGRRDIEQSSTVMLQPGRLQRMVEPVKCPNVQFKTVWKYAEIPGNRRKNPDTLDGYPGSLFVDGRDSDHAACIESCHFDITFIYKKIFVPLEYRDVS